MLRYSACGFVCVQSIVADMTTEIDSMDEFKRVAYEVEDGVAMLQLQRPEKKNAIDTRMREEITAIIDHTSEQNDVKVLLVTGTEGSFSAGTDIEELDNRLPETPTEAITMDQFNLPEKIDTLEKPVIALLNGVTLGGGLELALACDFRLASTETRLGFPEIELGGFPAEGGTQRLPRETNTGVALFLILTGEIIHAERAYEYGLVQEVHEPDALETRGREIADLIAEKNYSALLLAKHAVTLSSGTNLQDGLDVEELLANVLEATPERKQRLDEFFDR